MMKKKVLYIQPLHPSGMDTLQKKYNVIVANNEDRRFLLDAIQDVNAIVTRLTKIDAELIAAGKKLEAIAKHGVGVDNIDLDAATERKIAVLTTGNANSLSVAEHTLFAIGAMAKRIAYLDKEMRLGHWEARDESGSFDLNGKIIGVVGLGRIGSEVAEMAKYGFHMEVLVYDPCISRASAEEQGFQYTDDLDALCRTVDVLTLHVPLMPSTMALIDASRLALMKPTACLANFSRGGIVDEAALYYALSQKRIAGAALDAFEQEPPNKDSVLLQLDNVLLSPHCGSFSEDARIRMSMQVARGIDDVLSGRIPQFAANKSQLYHE
jgi:D-3-phosphoglycerate dehydrogenase